MIKIEICPLLLFTFHFHSNIYNLDMSRAQNILKTIYTHISHIYAYLLASLLAI
jgi:hypothetical protein